VRIVQARREDMAAIGVAEVIDAVTAVQSA
jgi:hypothetical protein